MSAAKTKTEHAYTAPLTVEVSHRPGGVVVRLAGACTMEVASRISDALLKLAEQKPPLVAVDMSALDFIESSGLGGIVGGYLRLRRHHGELRVVSPRPAIREILELTRLTQLFKVYDSVDAALSAPLGG
jgi:anti-sigma B factor antagonist